MKREKVYVRVTNRVTYFLGVYPKEKISEVVRFRIPGYRFMPAYKQGRWDGYIRLLKYNRMGTGLFLAMRETIEEEAAISFIVTDTRCLPKINPFRLNIENARPYQIKGVDAMVAAAATGGIVLCATGSGKTFMAALFLKRLEGSAVFVVDELTLMAQAVAELQKTLGGPIGIVGKSIFDPQRITVATIQTIAGHVKDPKFKAWFKAQSVIIVDEFHNQMNDRTISAVLAMTEASVFALTATLNLTKPHIALPAYNLAGPVIFEYTLEKGQKEGFLANGVVIAAEIEQVGRRKEPYTVSYDRMIVNSKRRNHLIEMFVREAYERGKSIVLLIQRIDHLQRMTDRLGDIPHEVVYGGLESDERMKAKKKFDKGKMRLIIANQVFKKGIDIKKIDFIVDGAGLQGAEDAIQKFGRGTRILEGKNGLIYIDIMDKSVEGVVAKSAASNRFQRAGKRRIKAYKAKGIKVYRYSTSDEYNGEIIKKIIDLAESKLSKQGTLF